MLKPNTIKRINELVASRMPQFDHDLAHDIGKISQDLITRGLYNSTVQVVSIKSASENNLKKRAESIKKSIKEVCQAHGVRYRSSLPSELDNIFKQLYKKQLTKVNAKFNSSIPIENRRLCQIPELNPDISSYGQELQLFAEGLKLVTSRQKNRLILVIKKILAHPVWTGTGVIITIIFGVLTYNGEKTETIRKEKIPQDVNKITIENNINKKVEDITLLYLFENDFNNLLRAGKDIIFKDKNGSQITIKSKLYFDFLSQTEFIGFYIPSVQETFDICTYLAKNYNIALDIKKNAIVESEGPGLQPVNTNELKFSGRVFIYHEYPLLESQKRELFALYQKHNLSPQYRGRDYLSKKEEIEKSLEPEEKEGDVNRTKQPPIFKIPEKVIAPDETNGEVNEPKKRELIKRREKAIEPEDQ